MANQPKKYKKFVATAATATLVASAIVPVASAAGFSDVAGNDHEVAINALADAGIINGYADGSFKPNQTINRGQVVKLLGRYLEAQGQEIPADWNSKQRFNDLPTTAEAELVKYAALAKDAGVFNGSNGNLNAAQTMQRQQMAVVLVRAIKEIAGVDLVADYKKAGFVTEISDLEKAYSAEQRNAIVALEYAGITNVSNFNPGNSVTRGQFASFLYRTIENVINTPEAGVAAVKAVNNTTVEVTFDEEVDNVQALNFLISDLEVKNAAVKLTNKKVVVLTTAAQTADKEYTVSLGEDKIGTFKGIAAVVPTKVDLVEKSVQGKLGQQVTLKAQVTVAEGQSKAGVPVTFFIPGSSNGVKTPVTVEAVTNDEGIASYTYTRYAATNDTVTVYANGDRSKFSTGYVFWAVDQTLEITEVTTGNTINNGANKTYKVTYKHPETGKPVSGKVLNVSVKENIDVTVDKLQNVTVNGLAVVQTSDNNTRAAQITTDSKGEATFTVSGSNAEVTPVVFEATPVTTTNANGTVTTTGYTQKYTADTLQASAAKVTFGAIQAAYTLEVTRDGGEVAATGVENGRKYNLVVKDKDGKLAANETVNVAFNEDIDGVISTVTTAQFVKVENGKQVGYNGKKITVKTNSKGEASFVISADAVNTYATPIAWIDINNQSATDANLDKGEPSAVAPISYFQAPYLDGSKLVSYDGNDETDEFDGNSTATFKVQLTNQSGKVVTASGYKTENVSYTVYNTGAENVVVDGVTIAPNRVHTLVAKTGEIKVTSEKGLSTSVKVLATGVAKEINGNKEFAFTSKEATAKFTAAKEVPSSFTGFVTVFNSADSGTDSNSIWFDGKNPVKYAGVSGKTFKYFGANGNEVFGEAAWEALLNSYVGHDVRVSYNVDGDTISFKIITVSVATPTTGLQKYAGTPAANNPPVAKVVGDQTIAINATPVEFTASQLASDVDGDTLTILSAYADNATIATAAVASGGAKFTLTPGTNVGTTTVNAVVADSKGATVTTTFKLTVTAASYTTVIGNPARGYVAPKVSTATLTAPSVTAPGNITVSIDGGVTTTLVTLADNASAADIAGAINTQAGTSVTATVDGADVVLKSKAEGAKITTALGTATGTGLATTGTDGAAVTAQYSFKVDSAPATATKFKVAVGANFYEYTSPGSPQTAAQLATAIAAELATQVTANNANAKAFDAKYKVTEVNGVITIEQKTAAASTDQLAVTATVVTP
ncbi:S-layer homology domain-containing protein [Lysinibacillus sp. NPDC093197]|uniref:S-layer homology domain-containing protein n=1 Tax=Lysinibacillus sp. NPDC093197 TaxID=3364132 RepID=UPI0037F113AE